MKRITNRLELREFTRDDLETTLRYAGDFDCVEFMLWGPNTIEETKAFVFEAIENQSITPRKKYDFALIDASGIHIGGCGIYLDDTMKKAEVGWILRREEWGKGYGSEAARELINFGFDELGLSEISATCDVRNIASAKVMRKCGMELKLVLKNHRRDKQTVDLRHDQLVYSIVR